MTERDILPYEDYQLRISQDSIYGRVGFSVTLDSVLMLTNCIANYCAKNGIHLIRIGFDSSAWAGPFAEEVISNRLSHLGFDCQIIERPCPIFQLSWAVNQGWEASKHATPILGIYVGTDGYYEDQLSFHFRHPDGLPYSESEVASIAAEPSSIKLLEKAACYTEVPEYLNIQDYPKYLTDIRAVTKTRLKKLPMVVDSMFGASESAFSELFSQYGMKGAVINRATNLLKYVNYLPRPTGAGLQWRMESSKGISSQYFAIDGDGDSIGLMDVKQELEISPSGIYCILLKYLAEVKKRKGTVLISKALSDKVQQIAHYYGFKTIWLDSGIAEFSKTIRTADKRSILMYGDETGGFWFKGDVMDRNSMITSLLITEACDHFKMSPGEILDEMYNKILEKTFVYGKLEIPDRDASKKFIEDVIETELTVTSKEKGLTTVYKLENSKIVLVRQEKFKYTSVYIESIDENKTRDFTQLIKEKVYEKDTPQDE
jgi:phosphomannomutase